MPILKPEIREVLKSCGLANDSPEGDIKEKLAASGLSLESTLNTVSHLMDHADSDAIRLKAAEDSLKIHGLMRDQAAPPPSVTIIIKDHDAPSINPILIPRQTQKVEVIQ